MHLLNDHHMGVVTAAASLIGRRTEQLVSNSVADPGSGAFLTPGSGMGKKNQEPDPGSGSGMNILDRISES